MWRIADSSFFMYYYVVFLTEKAFYYCYEAFFPFSFPFLLQMVLEISQTDRVVNRKEFCRLIKHWIFYIWFANRACKLVICLQFIFSHCNGFPNCRVVPTNMVKLLKHQLYDACSSWPILKIFYSASMHTINSLFTMYVYLKSTFITASFFSFSCSLFL